MSEKILLGNYGIISEIGRGGFSAVYLAEELIPLINNSDAETNNEENIIDPAITEADSNKNLYAIKKITIDKHEYSLFSAIEREIKILQEINHHRIPRLVDFFKLENANTIEIYIVQEYIKAKSLQAIIKDGKVFNEAEAVNIILQILKILEYLHNALPQIIHRDIKPSNILINEQNKVFMIDFGAVKEKVSYGNMSKSGISTIIGTQGYMPIEQFEGRASTASDFYSLGLTIIYLLSHKEPLQIPKDGLYFSLDNIINISDNFMSILKKMTEPDYTKRYTTAFEIKRDLNQLNNKIEKKITKKNSFFKLKNDYSNRYIRDLAREFTIPDEEIIYIDRPSIREVIAKASLFVNVGRGVAVFITSVFLLLISLVLLLKIGFIAILPVFVFIVGIILNLISIGLISRPYFMIKTALNTAYVITNKKIMVISLDKNNKKMPKDGFLSNFLGMTSAIGNGYSIKSSIDLFPMIMIRMMENETESKEIKRIIGYLELPKFTGQEELKKMVIERQEYKNGSGDLTFFDYSRDKTVPVLKLIGLKNVRKFEKIIIDTFR